VPEIKRIRFKNLDEREKMPIYEYKCTTCAHKFEEIVKSGTMITECELCGDEAQKLVSQDVGLEFRGGGWTENSSRFWKPASKMPEAFKNAEPQDG